MKTVASPIYFGLYKVQKPQHRHQQKGKKEFKPLKGFLAGGTDVGRTGHHEDYGCPNFGRLRSKKTIIPMP